MTIIASVSVPEHHRLDRSATTDLAAIRRQVAEQAEALSLTDSTRCPSWCVIHCPGDGSAILHVGDDLDAPASAGGPAEAHTFHVSVEQEQHTDGHLAAASVRVDDHPMTPYEALALIAALELAVRQAMGRAR